VIEVEAVAGVAGGVALKIVTAFEKPSDQPKTFPTRYLKTY